MASLSTPSTASILYYVDDFFACGWYRCHVPGTALLNAGYRVVLADKIGRGDIDAADVVVFQRKHSKSDLELIEYANSKGKTTVFEVDDDLTTISPANPAFKYWSDPSKQALFAACMRECQLVTTTTPYLAEKLGRINRNTVVCPNMLPDEYWPFSDVKRQTRDRVTVGWAGSISHAADLSEITPVILQILDEHPNVDFVFAGDNVPFQPHERARKMDAVRLEQYPWLVRHFDIGLAPLEDNVFNRCKSDLKFVELSMAGVPTIASKVESYVNSIEDGRTGFFARNAKDWLKHLRALIDSPELRTEVAGRAQGFARTRLADRNAPIWERAYGLLRV